MESANLTTLTSPRDLVSLLAADASFCEVARTLRAGQSATVDGAWGSARGMALAALASAAPRLLAIVVPKSSDVDPLLADLAAFGSPPAIYFPPLLDLGRLVDESGLPAHESFGQRLAVIKALEDPRAPAVLVTTMASLMQPVPSREALASHSRPLVRGKPVDVDELLAWLIANGWHRRDAVELAGEFSLRGGILDLFPQDTPDPFRVELFGDEVESIREFSVESQRSLREVDRVIITALGERETMSAEKEASGATTHFVDLLPDESWIALVEPIDLKAEGKLYLGRLEDPRMVYSVEQTWKRAIKRPTVTVTALPHATVETTCSLRVESVERFSGDVGKLRDELDKATRGDRVLLLCHNEAERTRLGDVLADSTLSRDGRLVFSLGRLSSGFRWVTAGVVVLSDHDLFRRADLAALEPKRRAQGKAIDSFLDLREGDYVVHLGHGIGVFRGMRMLEKNDQLEEHLSIEFADNVLVYAPASKIDLVQKYVGASQSAPRLSKVGGVSWERRKKQVERAVRDLASDLIDVQASRQAVPGNAFPPDSEWMREFEAAFPYTETPDQLLAMEEIRGDMQSARPMDRLICGDVGYGKTELAMRAAFKAVDSGKQVAVLVPTTVLAQQHLRSFRQRMAEFPFVVEAISRFETRGKQKEVLTRAKAGEVDILIGTHRLLSADVAFADLGLLIIDEEQRFGVEHKERLKRLRSQVDVLTLTATPIPRTLHSALLGIRDISNLETPPPNRLAVETRVSRFDPEMVRHAIVRELSRDGQIYFVHNRVGDIQAISDRIQRIVPESRIAIIHGQMPEEQIEAGMVAFLDRRADILLATTIIESGLDIPSANTIFINEADHYGLADLHQLRGRVGRSATRAYCYVLIDDKKAIKPDAQRRLKAIEEYSQLGAGFQIALRDLEIRGAGNILGTEQSGHIAAVGYELYCQLLENAVRRMKRLPVRHALDVTIELPWKAYLPAEYLPGERYRIDAYRRIARARSPDELAEIRAELEDRAGKLPEPAAHFLDLAELRLCAQIWQVEAVRPDPEGNLLLSYRDERRIATLARLRNNQVKPVDPVSAYIRVAADERNAAGYASLLKRLLQPN